MKLLVNEWILKEGERSIVSQFIGQEVSLSLSQPITQLIDQSDNHSVKQ